MSFRCDECGQAFFRYQKPVIIVRKIRQVHYKYNVQGRKTKPVNYMSEGFEIALEQKLCSKCGKEFSGKQPEMLSTPNIKTVNILIRVELPRNRRTESKSA